jgi:hypothetical protein
VKGAVIEFYGVALAFSDVGVPFIVLYFPSRQMTPLRTTSWLAKSFQSRFFLILWLVEVIEGFVHLLYSAKWPLDLTFRAGCHSSANLALWQVSTHINVQVAHDLLKHVAPGDRTVI